MNLTTTMNLSELTEEQRQQALHHLRCAARARALQWDHERQIEQIIDREIDNSDEIITCLAGDVNADAEDINPSDLTFITEQDLQKYCNA